MPDNGVQLLESLRSLGVTVRVVGPDRLSLEPASRIPAEMVPLIREAKPAILQALRERIACCWRRHRALRFAALRGML